MIDQRSCCRRALFLLLAGALLPTCATSQDPPPPPASSTVTTLDRILAETPEHSASAAAKDISSCLTAVEQQFNCPTDPGWRRTAELRLALDRRYTRQWPSWMDRLEKTFLCVNTLYQDTGLSWSVTSVTQWDPGRKRHDLYALLRRLQTDYPADAKRFTLGITVWDEQRIYSRAPGEIGLSQRTSCVVPSWPRIENDCLILAHELGHLVGARHVPGKRWIMAWAAQVFHLPAQNPVGRVMATYRFHPRNRAAIKLLQHARQTPAGLSLPPACRQKLAAIDRCWQLKKN